MLGFEYKTQAIQQKNIRLHNNRRSMIQRLRTLIRIVLFLLCIKGCILRSLSIMKLTGKNTFKIDPVSIWMPGTASRFSNWLKIWCNFVSKDSFVFAFCILLWMSSNERENTLAWYEDCSQVQSIQNKCYKATHSTNQNTTKAHALMVSPNRMDVS